MYFIYIQKMSHIYIIYHLMPYKLSLIIYLYLDDNQLHTYNKILYVFFLNANNQKEKINLIEYLYSFLYILYI